MLILLIMLRTALCISQNTPVFLWQVILDEEEVQPILAFGCTLFFIICYSLGAAERKISCASVQ